MKSNFTPLDSTIHETVLAYRSPTGERGAKALAPKIGLRVRTCQNKANPHQTAFYFRPSELVLLQQVANNPAILHAMAAALGYVCTPLDPGPGGGEPLQALATWTARQSDTMWAVVDYLMQKDSLEGANLSEIKACHFASAGQGLVFLQALEVQGHG